MSDIKKMTSPWPEIIIKMSSLLNVSNASSKSEDDINVLCFIKKNNKEGHPYYVIQCQYRQPEEHKQWLKLRYPRMVVVDECDDPNAIHRWNRNKREVIKKPNYYKKPFQPDQREARTS